jgi:guanylate kinase
MASAAPVVLAAPSGTGKTTIARSLVGSSDRYVFSVSATTRAPRAGERDGVDYHFRDRAAFERMAADGELAEWAEVHGRLYGTPREGLREASGRGEHVVLDIDVQGARQIRASVPEAVLIFVLPPNIDIMMSRLSGRGTEEPTEIARRLRSAMVELEAVSDFDHVVVNDRLDRCVETIRAIVEQGYRADPSAHVRTAERYRGEIRRILDQEYAGFAHQRQEEK